MNNYGVQSSGTLGSDGPSNGPEVQVLVVSKMHTDD